MSKQINIILSNLRTFFIKINREKVNQTQLIGLTNFRQTKVNRKENNSSVCFGSTSVTKLRNVQESFQRLSSLPDTHLFSSLINKTLLENCVCVCVWVYVFVWVGGCVCLMVNVCVCLRRDGRKLSVVLCISVFWFLLVWVGVYVGGCVCVCAYKCVYFRERERLLVTIWKF